MTQCVLEPNRYERSGQLAGTPGLVEGIRIAPLEEQMQAREVPPERLQEFITAVLADMMRIPAVAGWVAGLRWVSKRSPPLVRQARTKVAKQRLRVDDVFKTLGADSHLEGV
jgi:hypothetical protein